MHKRFAVGCFLALVVAVPCVSSVREAVAEETMEEFLLRKPQNADERYQQYVIINKMTREQRKELFAKRSQMQRETSRQMYESLTPEEQQKFISKSGLKTGRARTAY